MCNETGPENVAIFRRWDRGVPVDHAFAERNPTRPPAFVGFLPDEILDSNHDEPGHHASKGKIPAEFPAFDRCLRRIEIEAESGLIDAVENLDVIPNAAAHRIAGVIVHPPVESETPVDFRQFLKFGAGFCNRLPPAGKVAIAAVAQLVIGDLQLCGRPQRLTRQDRTPM